MPQDFDPDKFMEGRRGTAPQPKAPTGDFDPDAFMQKRRSPPKPRKPATVLPTERQEFRRRQPDFDTQLRLERGRQMRQPQESPLMDYDPAGYDIKGRPLTPQREAFAKKPLLERKAIQAHEAFAKGGLGVSKMARQGLGAGLGAVQALQGGRFEQVDMPAWRKREEEAAAELERRRLARPAPSFGEEIGAGILEGTPAAAGALGLGALTGGGALGTMAIGGGMSAAGADWRDPKRAALETGVGAVAPVIGGRVGQRVGGAVAGRLARPAAQKTAVAGGELLGGGLGNVGGAMAMGETQPRELARQFAVGAGLSAPGAAAAARRPIPARPVPPDPALQAAQARAAQGRVATTGATGPLTAPLPRTPGGAIIVPRSSLPSRKLLPPGRPEDVPTEQLDARGTGRITVPQPDAPPTGRFEYPDAPETQRVPVITPEMIAAENATTRGLPQRPIRQTKEVSRQPDFVRPTAEIPRQRPAPERAARAPQTQPRPITARRPTERLPVPIVTDENIEQLRQRQNELGRLAYDRRGDFTGDLRDEHNEINAAIREFENQRAPRELAPPEGRQEQMTPPPEESQARRAALEPRTAPLPETLTPGRKVTQEVQIPGQRAAETFISREDARQGHFERFDDQELVAEIARLENVRNQSIRGRSRLTPEQLEANRFDLKIATQMQKERRRIQRQMGMEGAEGIQPRTPGRTFTRHPETEAPTAAPEQPAGKQFIWQQTRAEVLADIAESQTITNYASVQGRQRRKKGRLEFHRESVERALREGKSVPPEVLADFPDLQPQAAETPPARKIQHSRLGEVSEAADQSRVPKGKLRVVDAEGKPHLVQNPRTQGNKEASFVKAAPETKPSEAPAKIGALNDAARERLLAAAREQRDLSEKYYNKKASALPSVNDPIDGEIARLSAEFYGRVAKGENVESVRDDIAAQAQKAAENFNARQQQLHGKAQKKDWRSGIAGFKSPEDAQNKINRHVYQMAKLIIEKSQPASSTAKTGPAARPAAAMQRGKPEPPNIVQRMARIARSPESPVSITKLRAEFPEMSKADFDAAMTKLNEEGRISLHRHDAPGQLSEADRANLVQIGKDYFTAATIRQRPGTVMGGMFGGLQGMFERKAPKPPKPGQGELFEGGRAEKKEPASLGSALGAVSRGAGNEMRTLMTIADFSAIGNQGFWLSVSNPAKAIRSGREMVRSFTPRQAKAVDDAIVNHPLRDIWEQSDLYTATGERQKAGAAGGEEAFRGVLAEAPGFKFFERTYRTYLDTLRVSVFESYAKALQKQGITFDNNPKAYRDVAAFINIATGRGQLKKGGMLEKASDLAGAFAFAPRNLIANFQLLDPVRYVTMEPAARKLALKDSLTTLGVIVGTATLLRQAGVMVGFEPEKDDFMIARAGNTRYDLTGGRKAQVQFLARLVKGAHNQATGEGNLPGKDPLSVTKTFAESKASPLISTALTFGRGETFTGKKLSEMSKGEIALETGPWPMLAKDMIEVYREEGLKGVAKTTPAIIGARVRTYPDRAKSAFLDVPAELRAEQKRGGETRPFLTPRGKREPAEQDETPQAFAARKAKADGWMQDYGRRLVSSPAYRSASDELKADARAYLQRTVADQSGEKRPNLGLLRPGNILRTVRESARKKQRAARR